MRRRDAPSTFHYPSISCPAITLPSSRPNTSLPVSSKTTAPQQISRRSPIFNTSKYCLAHLHRGARMVVAQQVPQRAGGRVGGPLLTISKLKRWSINYYIDTAQAAEHAARICSARAAGWGSTTPNTRPEPRYGCWPATPTPRELVGLTDAQRAGGDADAEVVARWLDDGVAPNGAHGRAFGERGVHGFDLTFCAPKSVSLLRALRTDDVVAKAIADAHTTALAEAMEYLAAHAGYTRVHNPRTGEKDLVRLPGLVAIAYQHETSRCGDPHLHTHVIVPNRQARADGATGVDRRDVAVSRSPSRRGHLSGHPAPRTAPIDGIRVGAGGSVHRDGRAGRGGPRHHHRVVAALHPAAGVGGPQPRHVVDGR